MDEGWSGDGERVASVSMGRVRSGGHWGGGALERGHGAALEPLAQLGDALVSDEVAGETAREGGGGGIASMSIGR